MSAEPPAFHANLALQRLRDRLGELADLAAAQMLLEWDQLVMMPPGGGSGRAQQLGTLARLIHERATADEIGGWLDELDGAEPDGRRGGGRQHDANRPAGSQLEELERNIVRVARRDWERARRVPKELAVERARASTDGQEIWQRARAQNDFAAFAPALERNLELARAYGQCVAEEGQSAYEGLLADYDFGLREQDLRRVFGELGGALPPLIREAASHPLRRPVEVPVEAQRGAVAGTLRRLGVDRESWRVDVSTHPFTAWMGRGDVRITTRYADGDVESLLSSLHEYGHALYERQVDPALDRTNLGGGTSMSIHESQSKLWENHVARNPAFAELLASELRAAGFPIEAHTLHASLVGVEPSEIRVSADPLTYPLHIILRFELELALISGELAVADLPAAWNDGMRRLLGVKVRSDAHGCLQDVHWSAGSFGYFPSYALGCLIAAQLWETIEAQLGSREDDLRRGEVAPIQRWLGEHVHRHGRRLDTMGLVQLSTGRPLETAPFLRYVVPLAQRGADRSVRHVVPG